MLKEVSGNFVKIVFVDDLAIHLSHGNSDRPAARYNRPGEDALYLSQTEESARLALRKYIKPDDPERVLINYQVEPCLLLDLRHPEANDLYNMTRSDWLEHIADGQEPPSWHVADHIREENCVGLIDPSRQSPDFFNITLFHWNKIGGPKVTQIGDATPVQF